MLDNLWNTGSNQKINSEQEALVVQAAGPGHWRGAAGRERAVLATKAATAAGTLAYTIAPSTALVRATDFSWY